IRTRGFTAGPGFRQYNFGGGPHQRFQARRQQQQQQQATGAFQFLQLLPILALLFISIFSGLFREAEPTFAWKYQPSHPIGKHTVTNGVTFFVDAKLDSKIREDGKYARKLGQQVDGEWLNYLRHECGNEEQRRQIRINNAQGFFSVDKKKLNEARNMKMPKCDEFKTFHRKIYGR
ncbi:hypothetical protein HK097_003905, partial [Rhizophlyctis rosea]